MIDISLSPLVGVLVIVCATLTSYLGVALLRRWAGRHLLDIPNERSSHVRPTPRGGGLAIVVVTVAGLIGGWAVTRQPAFAAVLGFVAGAVAVATVSWVDDLRSVSSRLRLAVHAVAAGAAVMTVGYMQDVALPFVGTIHLGWVGIPITLVWIVGLVNAFNFMDGIDGIAGGQAVVGAAGWALLASISGQEWVAWAALLLASSSLGFLLHNWAPARIFMGDVGSAFLGYSFAVLVIAANAENDRLLVAGVLLLWPFLFDTVFTIIRRGRKGENVFAAHRSHLYQRLVIAGYSHRHVASLYIVLSVLGFFTALVWVNAVTGSDLLVLLVPLLMAWGLWLFVTRQESLVKAANRL